MIEAILILAFGGVILLVAWLAARYGAAKHAAGEAVEILESIAQEKADDAKDAPRFGSVFDRVREQRRK